MALDDFEKSGLDQKIEDRITYHCHSHRIEPLDAIKLFPVLARRQWLKRFLAYTELFKLTLGIPGDVVELGVFRGLGLMTWANLLEAYCIGNRTKVVYGFDNWKGIRKLDKEDGEEIVLIGKRVGGFSPEKFYEELVDAISIYDSDRFITWKPRVKLVVGDIEHTIPTFVRENSGIRFSLIHFDCDMYSPTKIALGCLYPLVSRGGVVLFDEYAIPGWSGETKAVDEYFADKEDVRMHTFPWTNIPAGYVIKS